MVPISMGWFVRKGQESHPLTMKHTHRTLPASLVAVLIASTLSVQAIERVNFDSSNNPPTTGVAFSPSASADGRYVVFSTNADLVPADTNFDFDIYLRDRLLGTTTCVSVDSMGVPVGQAYSATISADGKFVAFDSGDSTLFPSDTNGTTDVFVRDLVAGTTSRISVPLGGGGSGGGGTAPSISGDGRYVVFSSFATDLIASDTNSFEDIFLRDRQAGTTVRISRGPAPGFAETDSGSDMPSISEDGSKISFRSFATNLVSPATDGTSHVFVYDVASGAIELVSQSTGGVQGDFDSMQSRLTANGSHVVFESSAGNLVAGDDMNFDGDVFVRDLAGGTTIRVSHASNGDKQDGIASGPAISRDGRYVAFTSTGSNLAPESTGATGNLYVRDLVTGQTRLVTVGIDGMEGDDATWAVPAFVDNATGIVFESSANNLIAGDTLTSHDIFYAALTNNNQALKASLTTQIKKLNAKVKIAKKKGQTAKAKRLLKKARKLKQRLRSL